MEQVKANTLSTIPLGRQGENLARQILFDVSGWETEYGLGVVELIAQRPGEAQPYPVAVHRNGTIVTWDVSSTDTEMPGDSGKCELRYYVGEVLAKSKTWRLWVEPAMDTPSETAPPEPEQGWVDQIIAVGAAAKASADAAKADADRAAALAAEVAANAAKTAQEASVAEQAKEAAQTAQRLAEAAKQAAETAQKAAEEAKAAAAQSATDAATAKSGAETALKSAQDAAAAAAQALADIRALYQEMQTWAQGVIQDVNAAGSAAVQSVQSAGDTQVQRVTDEGTRQTANAKAQADAAAQSAAGAAQSAQEAAGSAAVYDTVAADVTKLKQDLNDIGYTKVYEDAVILRSDEWTDGKYINNNGIIKNASGYHMSNYIPVIPGKTIYLKARTSGNISCFLYTQYFGFFDADKNWIGGKNEFGEFTYHTSGQLAYKSIPENARFLVISANNEHYVETWASYTGAPPTGKSIYVPNSEHLDYSAYPENPCEYSGNEICVFNKIVCIGDSITMGAFNNVDGGSSGGITRDEYSYPTKLKKITGVDTTNLGRSGTTSTSWWNLYKDYDFSGYDCAIINLGINDAEKGSTDEETRTAYANIIAALKSANNGIKIFIATINPAYARFSTYYDWVNDILREFASNEENCYLVDLTAYGHTVGIGDQNGHLTALGYMHMAKDLASAISWIIKMNPEEFRFVQFIGTDSL